MSTDGTPDKNIEKTNSPDTSEVIEARVIALSELSLVEEDL